ncbi:MAG: rhomboid family intramembrane serine protease [Bacteroidales bacterium]|jgi:membrane associated rhomboid family serine protease|nr:rhomboid family intramembrane serine protease [Bacteroidales bacterium]
MNSDYQYSPQKFSVLPPVCKNLIIINAIAYLATYVLQIRNVIDLTDILGLHLYASSHHHVWQYFTYAFMHGGFTHLFMNMFALWMFGSVLENVWGARKFLIYCFVAAIGAAIIQQLTYWFMYHDLVADVQRIAASSAAFVNTDDGMMTKEIFMEKATFLIDHINTVGASGIVFGLLLAFGLTFPNTYVYFYFLVPIKAKWFVLGYVLLELFEGVFRSADGVAHFAHLGGALAGLILLLIWNKGWKRRYY